MNRNRLVDFRLDSGTEIVGYCMNDQARIARLVNKAQRRLLMARESGDEGWYGTWAEMAFTVSQTAPYLTLPRHVARIEKMSVCQVPVNVQNQFFEYLAFGCGPQPNRCIVTTCGSDCLVTAYSRNNAVLFTDMNATAQYLRVYTTDNTGQDLDKRVFVQGVDSTGNTIRTQDNDVLVQGIFNTIQTPFFDISELGSPILFNSITGIQKDVTVGSLQFFQVDPGTGFERLLLIMEPTEKVASYRRYFLNPLPCDCCDGSTGIINVDCIVKLELIPVEADTDYLLIQNIEALVHEAQSIRYSEMDGKAQKEEASWHHREAIRLLQGEIQHYLGKEKPAMSFYPFGSVTPESKGIGMI